MVEDIRNSNAILEKHPPKQLPYKTSSICPVCLYSNDQVKVIDALVFEENGKIWISKNCEDHGFFKDIYWSDATLFRRVMKYWYKSIPLDNPRTKTDKGCPYDCGPCPAHLAQTSLGLIDVTNRCNMQCPICFASASNPVVYEPTPKQVLDMMKNLRTNLPGPTAAVQFAGGEPTLSDNLIDYVRWAEELGFRHIMIATNGLRFANNPDFLKQLVEVGLKTIYLQFDGVTEKPYLEMRGKDYRNMKDKTLDSARYANLDGVILVPTVAKGVNDDQLGDIIDYAITHRDIVRCVNFQPVSITGRIKQHEREKVRITIPDAIHLIEKQTNGGVKVDDWYPVSSMNSVGRALGLLRGENFFELHSHFACGMATFLFINDDGSYVPITEVVDLEALLVTLEEICELYSSGSPFAGIRSKLKLFAFLRKVKKKSYMKPLISSFLRKGTYSSLRAFMSKVIMLGMMHFQDAWNLDLERVKHCTINYATPDGRIISFCTYNNIHRTQVEQKFSRPS